MFSQLSLINYNKPDVFAVIIAISSYRKEKSLNII